jgi:hypothetical protein
METEVCRLILTKVEDQKRSIELFLAGGGAKSYEEYSRMVGEYSALLKMEGDIKDVEQRFLES